MDLKQNIPPGAKQAKNIGISPGICLMYGQETLFTIQVHFSWQARSLIL